MADIYTLLLRSDASYARPAEREGLLRHLTRIPGVVERAPDRYVFGDEDEHGIMELDVFVRRDGARVEPRDVSDDESARCDEIEVRVPRPWVMENGPRVFALIFMLAEWAKWEVHDTQIDDTLQKDAVLSGLVAMRQAQRNAEASGDPGAAGGPVDTHDPAVTTSRPARPDSGIDPPPVEDYQPTTTTPPAEKPKAKRRPWWKLGG